MNETGLTFEQIRQRMINYNLEFPSDKRVIEMARAICNGMSEEEAAKNLGLKLLIKPYEAGDSINDLLCI